MRTLPACYLKWQAGTPTQKYIALIYHLLNFWDFVDPLLLAYVFCKYKRSSAGANNIQSKENETAREVCKHANTKLVFCFRVWVTMQLRAEEAFLWVSSGDLSLIFLQITETHSFSYDPYDLWKVTRDVLRLLYGGVLKPTKASRCARQAVWFSEKCLDHIFFCSHECHLCKLYKGSHYANSEGNNFNHVHKSSCHVASSRIWDSQESLLGNCICGQARARDCSSHLREVTVLLLTRLGDIQRQWEYLSQIKLPIEYSTKWANYLTLPHPKGVLGCGYLGVGPFAQQEGYLDPSTYSWHGFLFQDICVRVDLESLNVT